MLLYILAIYSLILLAFRTRFSTSLQGIFIRLSYSALGVTILFSLVYAANNVFRMWACQH
ncbi:hypothetical protein [Bacillus sp. V5-8f]|uniref:hypothetical protein n=1 Tax=Bacillus sp. V5-8f TaxID=2053044 RepID=UPI0021558ACC|nr:hypothetical protein [Bacillus sp. V5-8f]